MPIGARPLAMVAWFVITITTTSLDIPFSRFEGHSIHLDRFIEDHQKLNNQEKSLSPTYRLSGFYSLVTFGHQSLPVLFSTTADSDFIVGKSCTNCLYTIQPFDTDQEPSFIQSNDLITVHDGRVKGKISMCSFKVDGKSGGETEFLLADSVRYPLQHSGILSLSPKQTSFLTKIYEKGLIDEKIFSLKYSEALPNIRFGFSEDELEYYEFYQLHDKESWSIYLEGVSLDGKDLSHAPFYTEFDTSTDLFILPEYTAKNILAALHSNGWKCQLDKSYNNGQLTCDRSSIGKPFTLILRFDGRSYSIPSSSILGECVTNSFEGQGYHCTTLIALNDKEDSAILGHSILQNFEIIFDAKVGRIGIAEAIIKNSKYPSNKQEATKGIIFLFMFGVLLIAFLLVIVWIIRKIRLNTSKQINFDDDDHGGGVELA